MTIGWLVAVLNLLNMGGSGAVAQVGGTVRATVAGGNRVAASVAGGARVAGVASGG